MPDGALITQTKYSYDPQGHVLSDTRTIDTQSYLTAYSYDSAGRLSGGTYATGTLLTYSFDGLGRVQRIIVNRGGTDQILVDEVTAGSGTCAMRSIAANNSSARFARNCSRSSFSSADCDNNPACCAFWAN